MPHIDNGDNNYTSKIQHEYNLFMAVINVYQPK